MSTIGRCSFFVIGAVEIAHIQNVWCWVSFWMTTLIFLPSFKNVLRSWCMLCVFFALQILRERANNPIWWTKAIYYTVNYYDYSRCIWEQRFKLRRWNCVSPKTQCVTAPSLPDGVSDLWNHCIIQTITCKLNQLSVTEETVLVCPHMMP